MMMARVTVMIGHPVADDRSADAPDHRAYRPGDYCAADRSGRRAANDAFLGRLDRAGEAYGEHRERERN